MKLRNARVAALLPLLLLPSTAMGIFASVRIANAQTASSQAPVGPQTAGPAINASAETTAAIDAALAASPGLRHGIAGIYVRSLGSGAVIYAKNEDVALLPASCNKLLTVSTALTQLGPSFVYHTTLYRTGTLGNDGVLTGDLILRGSGDPSFSAEDLTILARALRASGIQEVRGRLLADDSRFDSERLGSGWAEDDDAYDYQAQISALNCDENVVAVKVAPGAAVGAPATATLVPGTGYAAITNSASTVVASTSTPNVAHIGFDRARAENRLLVSGTIPLGAEPTTAALTIEDPGLFAVTRLSEILPSCGVAVPAAAGAEGKIGHGTVPVQSVVVATKDSAPLTTLVTHLLKESDNLYAETLLKTIGAEKGTLGSAREGARIVRGLLQDAGIDVSGINQVDGCGLSRSDLVTPHALVDLLTFVDQKSPPDVRAALEGGLPVAGVDGTLRRRMKGTLAEGKVIAKTGSLNHVSCLAGFVTTRNGDRLVFAMMMNNYLGSATAAHTAQDKIAALLAGL